MVSLYNMVSIQTNKIIFFNIKIILIQHILLIWKEFTNSDVYVLTHMRIPSHMPNLTGHNTSFIVNGIDNGLP